MQAEYDWKCGLPNHKIAWKVYIYSIMTLLSNVSNWKFEMKQHVKRKKKKKKRGNAHRIFLNLRYEIYWQCVENKKMSLGKNLYGEKITQRGREKANVNDVQT